jgi:hypothetical protein
MKGRKRKREGGGRVRGRKERKKRKNIFIHLSYTLFLALNPDFCFE